MFARALNRVSAIAVNQHHNINEISFGLIALGGLGHVAPFGTSGRVYMAKDAFDNVYIRAHIEGDDSDDPAGKRFKLWGVRFSGLSICATK